MQLQQGLQEQNTKEISLYQDKQAQPQLIATELAKLKAAFPAIEMSFISVLSERLQANGFTEQRLKDAISTVIDKFRYQKPNIADIIGFDKVARLYTWNEAFMEVEKGAEWTDFKIIEKNGVKFRVKINAT